MFLPFLKADSGTITETSSPALPTASVKVLPTAWIVPFTATAMSRGCRSAPFTLADDVRRDEPGRRIHVVVVARVGQLHVERRPGR